MRTLFIFESDLLLFVFIVFVVSPPITGLQTWVKTSRFNNNVDFNFHKPDTSSHPFNQIGRNAGRAPASSQSVAKTSKHASNYGMRKTGMSQTRVRDIFKQIRRGLFRKERIYVDQINLNSKPDYTEQISINNKDRNTLTEDIIAELIDLLEAANSEPLKRRNDRQGNGGRRDEGRRGEERRNGLRGRKEGRRWRWGQYTGQQIESVNVPEEGTLLEHRGEEVLPDDGSEGAASGNKRRSQRPKVTTFGREGDEKRRDRKKIGYPMPSQSIESQAKEFNEVHNKKDDSDPLIVETDDEGLYKVDGRDIQADGAKGQWGRSYSDSNGAAYLGEIRGGNNEGWKREDEVSDVSVKRDSENGAVMGEPLMQQQGNVEEEGDEGLTEDKGTFSEVNITSTYTLSPAQQGTMDEVDGNTTKHMNIREDGDNKVRVYSMAGCAALAVIAAVLLYVIL